MPAEMARPSLSSSSGRSDCSGCLCSAEDDRKMSFFLPAWVFASSLLYPFPTAPTCLCILENYISHVPLPSGSWMALTNKRHWQKIKAQAVKEKAGYVFPSLPDSRRISTAAPANDGRPWLLNPGDSTYSWYTSSNRGGRAIANSWVISPPV